MKIHAFSTYRASCLKCVHRQCVGDVNDIPSNQLKKKTKNRYREIGLYNLKILCISAHAHLCFQQQQPAVFSEKALIILLHTTVQYLLCTKQQSDPERDRVVNMVER